MLPGYPFQRSSYWSVPLGTSVEGLGTAERHIRTKNRSAKTRPRITGSIEERTRQLASFLKPIVVEVLGVESDTLSFDANLIELGLDSLRVMEVLASLRQKLEIVSTPAEFLAHASIDRFAAHLASQIVVEETDVSAESRPATREARRKGNIPLIVLKEQGQGTPVFCLHPAGGQVTAYMR